MTSNKFKHQTTSKNMFHRLVIHPNWHELKVNQKVDMTDPFTIAFHCYNACVLSFRMTPMLYFFWISRGFCSTHYYLLAWHKWQLQKHSRILASPWPNKGIAKRTTPATSSDKLLQVHTNENLEKRTPTQLQSTIAPQHLDVPLF